MAGRRSGIERVAQRNRRGGRRHGDLLAISGMEPETRLARNTTGAARA
jgi:hypothetical protein